MLHCNILFWESVFPAAQRRASAGFMKDHTMNTFERAGEAMLASADGNRQIAEAIWKGLGTLFARLARTVSSIFGTAQGPSLRP
jgi:hypothetical protein